jgi:hypothetical protein
VSDLFLCGRTHNQRGPNQPSSSSVFFLSDVLSEISKMPGVGQVRKISLPCYLAPLEACLPESLLANLDKKLDEQKVKEEVKRENARQAAEQKQRSSENVNKRRASVAATAKDLRAGAPWSLDNMLKDATEANLTRGVGMAAVMAGGGAGAAGTAGGMSVGMGGGGLGALAPLTSGGFGI